MPVQYQEVAKYMMGVGGAGDKYKGHVPSLKEMEQVDKVLMAQVEMPKNIINKQQSTIKYLRIII